MFFRKKEEKEEEEEKEAIKTLINRVESLEIKLKKVENEHLGLVSEQELIRNQILRKFQKMKKLKKDDEEEEDEQEFRPADGLPRAKDLNIVKPFVV